MNKYDRQLIKLSCIGCIEHIAKWAIVNREKLAEDFIKSLLEEEKELKSGRK